jgi:hypothetical protein
MVIFTAPSKRWALFRCHSSVPTYLGEQLSMIVKSLHSVECLATTDARALHRLGAATNLIFFRRMKDPLRCGQMIEYYDVSR